MLLLNEKPILFDRECLNFYATRYYDGTLAIVCETKNYEPYATISINLSDYGYQLTDDVIALNHDLSNGLRDLVIHSFGKEFQPIRYGYAESILLHLNSEVVEKLRVNKDQIEEED